MNRAAVNRAAVNRAAVNRANAQHSTGPRTKPANSAPPLNAIRHGLTAQTVVLPSEDAAAHQSHSRQFFSEYQPATPTETQLVQELIDTSWRLNRIPLLKPTCSPAPPIRPTTRLVSTSTSSTPTA